MGGDSVIRRFSLDPEYRRYRIGQSRRYLNGVRRQARHVAALEEDIALQRDQAAGVMGVDYTRVMVNTSVMPDALPEAVARLVDSIAECCVELAACVAAQDEARKLLAEMGGQKADILLMHYVAMRSWSYVAGKLGYAEGTVKNAAADALCDFFDYLPAGKRDARPKAYPTDRVRKS